MSLRRKLSVSSVLLGTLLFTRILPAQNSAADLVLIHGHILTVDANDSVAQAIAVRHGVIVKIGTDAEVLEFAGNAPGTRIIDLHGHTATPGLIDTHAHIADGGVENSTGSRHSSLSSPCSRPPCCSAHTMPLIANLFTGAVPVAAGRYELPTESLIVSVGFGFLLVVYPTTT